MKKIFFSIAILIGTIIGAGIFGIPYVVAKSGLIPSLFYFLILGGAMLLLHLFFGEIILRTNENLRLPGLAQKYIGGKAKAIVSCAIIVGTIGSLLAYLVIAGNFLHILFSPLISIDLFYFCLIFEIVLSIFIFKGIKAIAPLEIFTNSIFIFIILSIFIFTIPKINVQNFILFDSSFLFLPYGVILFALVGLSAVPELSEILKSQKERKSIKNVIIFSILFSILVYLFFAFMVVGTSGKQTSSDTLNGLLPFLGAKIIFLGALAAVITLADSFLVIAIYLKNTLIYDYKFSNFKASLLVCLIPLVLYLIGFRDFIGIISVVGIVFGTIEGIIIILLFMKAKKSGDRIPEYSISAPNPLLYLLILLFILGAIFQFI